MCSVYLNSNDRTNIQYPREFLQKKKKTVIVSREFNALSKSLFNNLKKFINTNLRVAFKTYPLKNKKKRKG